MEDLVYYYTEDAVDDVRVGRRHPCLCGHRSTPPNRRRAPRRVLALSYGLLRALLAAAGRSRPRDCGGAEGMGTDGGVGSLLRARFRMRALDVFFFFFF